MVNCSFLYLGVNVFESWDVVWKKPGLYNLHDWNDAKVDSCFHFLLCCSQLFYFSCKKCRVCNRTVSSFQQPILDLKNPIEFPKSMDLNSHFMRISASCCHGDHSAIKPQVYMLAKLGENDSLYGPSDTMSSRLVSHLQNVWGGLWKEFVKMSTV